MEKPEDFTFEEFFEFLRDEIPYKHAEYVEYLIKNSVDKQKIQDVFDDIVRTLNSTVCILDNGHDWIVNKKVYQKTINDEYDKFKKVLADSTQRSST